MVPEARLELARLERRGILNPLCTHSTYVTSYTDQSRVPSQYTMIHPLTLCGWTRSYIKILVCKAWKYVFCLKTT